MSNLRIERWSDDIGEWMDITDFARSQFPKLSLNERAEVWAKIHEVGTRVIQFKIVAEFDNNGGKVR